MKRFWTIFTIVTLISTIGIPLAGQKIDRESSDRSQIIHLKTALNHLTVIELREPVTQVATGSQSFKVEWRENKVFANQPRLMPLPICSSGPYHAGNEDEECDQLDRRPAAMILSSRMPLSPRPLFDGHIESLPRRARRRKG